MQTLLFLLRVNTNRGDMNRKACQLLDFPVAMKPEVQLAGWTLYEPESFPYMDEKDKPMFRVYAVMTRKPGHYSRMIL